MARTQRKSKMTLLEYKEFCRSRMLLVKLLAFSTTFSGIAWTRFQTVVLLNAGYSMSHIGAVKSLGFAAKFIITPVWAAIGDTYTPLKSLIVAFTIAGLSLEFVRQCIVHKWPFYVLVILRIFRSSSNSIGPLTDSYLVQSARENGLENESYGRQRLFGSLAWGTGSLLVGILIDANGLWIVFPFTYVMIALCIIVIILNIRQQRNSKQLLPGSSGITGTSKTRQKPHKAKNLCFVIRNMRDCLLSNPRLKFFSAQVVLLGFCMTLADTLIPIQLEKEFGLSRKLNGASTFIGILTSIPVFWWNTSILRAWGAEKMMVIAQVLMCARFLILGLLGKEMIWLLYGLFVQQLLHGVIFAMVWTASTDLVQSMAGVGLATSAQSLVSTLYFVCGQGLGNIFWLTIYGKSKYGASPLYFVGSALLIFNLFVFHRQEIISRSSQKLRPEILDTVL